MGTDAMVYNPVTEPDVLHTGEDFDAAKTKVPKNVRKQA